MYKDHVRYDDGDLPLLDSRFLQWKAEGRLIKICPEVFGGLPTPRPDCQRIGDRVIACTGEDATKAYEKGALEAVRLAKEKDVVCCIMKESSPSCGSHQIYDGTFTGTKIEGQGRAVELLRAAGFVVFSENDLDEVMKFIENQ